MRRCCDRLRVIRAAATRDDEQAHGDASSRERPESRSHRVVVRWSSCMPPADTTHNPPAKASLPSAVSLTAGALDVAIPSRRAHCVDRSPKLRWALDEEEGQPPDVPVERRLQGIDAPLQARSAP